jgi:hypothetical protein
MLCACLLLFTAVTSVAQEKTSPQAEKQDQKPDQQPKPAISFKGVQIGGLWYLSYQYGDQYSGTPGQTQAYNQFRVKRGYLDVRAELQPWLDVRFTPDVSQDSSGDLKVLMKYLYGRFEGKGNSIITRPYAEFGVVHMPWLDFEERVNRFRMQDTMFMERNGLFNSADIGILAGSNFGPDLSEEYRRDVNDTYAGRYGSWQFGVFNGGGYRARENNGNKVVEGRATVRPVPARFPGLQLSLFGVFGKGNLPEATPPLKLPDYEVLAGMVSYEHAYFVLTAQWYAGEGNAAGTAVKPDGQTASPQNGSSYFAEVRFTKKRILSAIGRYDRFDTDADDPGSDLQQRLIAGFAWQMFKSNYLLVDYDRVSHSRAEIPAEGRVQVTVQISF